LVLGLDGSVEAEGKDRVAYPCDGVYDDALALPGCQGNLLTAVSAVAPVVLVLVHGGPVTVTNAVNSNNVIAILDAFYPGPRGGDAVAATLFGDYNPGGRLPNTIFQSSTNIPDITNYDMVTSPGFTYKWYSGNAVPLFKFGYGLSYTTFNYSNLIVSSSTVDICENITLTFTITNTGSMIGDELAQLYISSPKQPSYPVPQKSLQGYKRIKSIPIGGKVTDNFIISAYSKHTVDGNGKRYINPGSYTFYIGGRQPDTLTGILSGPFTVTGSSTLVSECKNSPITYAC